MEFLELLKTFIYALALQMIYYRLQDWWTGRQPGDETSVPQIRYLGVGHMDVGKRTVVEDTASLARYAPPRDPSPLGTDDTVALLVASRSPRATHATLAAVSKRLATTVLAPAGRVALQREREASGWLDGQAPPMRRVSKAVRSRAGTAVIRRPTTSGKQTSRKHSRSFANSSRTERARTPTPRRP